MASVEPLRFRHDNPSWTSHDHALPNPNPSPVSPSSSPRAAPSQQPPSQHQYQYQYQPTNLHSSQGYPQDTRVSVNSFATSVPSEDDSASIYSNAQQVTTYHSPFLQSTASSPYDEQYRTSWQTDNTNPRPDSNLDPFGFRQYESARTPLPKVVVSSPSDTALRFSSGIYDRPDTYDEPVDPIVPPTPPPLPQSQGRTPSAVPGTFNFSRPHRPPIVLANDDQKHRVLARAAERTTSPLRPSSSSSSLNNLGNMGNSYNPNGSRQFGTPTISVTDGSVTNMIPSSSSSRSPSPRPDGADAYPTPRPSPQGMPSPSFTPGALSPGGASQYYASNASMNLVPLPAKLPSVRSSTPESVYSDYSYYPIDSALPSPTSPITQTPTNNSNAMKSKSPSPEPRASPNMLSPQAKLAEGGLKTPQELVQLGIEYHEADRLRESAYCFERSATENGGCAVGMLMWGLSLRHGWGCQKDEAKGFKWLQRAAEHAVVDLEAAKDGREALKKELVLAVYEVGQCFFQGWGVPRDKKMAVSYFQTAAQLGDPDAQQDLAFCLANGKGCKKDKISAAKWYRAAAEQGASTVGLAWIYKAKYM